MCLINFSFQHHPNYQFILAGNRDEFYNRPTKPLYWWNDHILAGQDLKDGGTWMGITRNGDFVALTNYRDLTHIKTDAPSRGIILKKFLDGELPLEEMHRFLRTQGQLYNGFNIIYGNKEELFYFSNVSGKLQQLYPGIYGLSNAFLDTPWTKLVTSKKNFTSLIGEPTIDEDAIIASLANEDPAPDAELPSTGASHDLEKRLSAMFIKSENYGTRITTFVSIDNHDHVVYREKSFIPPHDIRIEFNIKNRLAG